jgi:hypothetical protein
MNRTALLARIRELRQNNIGRSDAPPDASKIVSELATATRQLGLTIQGLPPIPARVHVTAIQFARGDGAQLVADNEGARHRAYHDALDLLESALARDSQGAAQRSGPHGLISEVTPALHNIAKLLNEHWPPATNQNDQEATPVGQLEVAQAEGGGARKGPSGESVQATVNARMVDMLMRRPESRQWSAREWATALQCGKSAVADTHCWEELQKEREQLRQDAISRARQNAR